MYLQTPAARPSLAWGGIVARALVVVAAALGAAAADTAPTGRPGADVVWRAVLAGAVTAAGLTAGPVGRLAPALVAGGVGAATGTAELAALAGALLVAGALAPGAGRHAAIASGVAVGWAVQLLFRLPHLEPDRITTAVACLAGAAVLGSGWRGVAPRGRRVVRWGALVVGGGLVLASLPFALSGVLVWRDVSRGSGEADAWRIATAEGDEERAAGHLDAAAAAFARADRRMAQWWMAPARVLPGVAQHEVAVDVGLTAGQRLVRSAQAILEVADPEDLRLEGGRVDVDLMTALRGPLGEGQRVLDEVHRELAAVPTRWLLPFIEADIDAVSAQVDEAAHDAAFADRVLAAVPGLVGGDEPRRYFVIFSSPSETRELGGFLGNWGILTARNGRLDLEETGRSGDLNLAGDVTLTDPESYPLRYVLAGPDAFWQNVTSSPDLPTVARAVADLYGQLTGDVIDGVLVVDPVALGGLLELTGPVDVPGLDGPLDAGNAADFLLREQYVEFQDLGERVDFLADAADATFDELTAGGLAGPREVADALGPMVRRRHLLFWSFDERAQPLLTELGLDGALPPVVGDVLAVARADAASDKLDAYLREELAYDAVVDARSGEVRTTLTATYTNEAPRGLPAYVAGNGSEVPIGTSRILLSVWSPYERIDSTLDGVHLPMERQRELGRNRYLAGITVPRGESRTMELVLEGVVPDEGYRLTVVRQPLAEPSPLQVTITGPDGRVLRDVPKTTVVGG